MISILVIFLISASLGVSLSFSKPVLAISTETVEVPWDDFLVRVNQERVIKAWFVNSYLFPTTLQFQLKEDEVCYFTVAPSEEAMLETLSILRGQGVEGNYVDFLAMKTGWYYKHRWVFPAVMVVGFIAIFIIQWKTRRGIFIFRRPRIVSFEELTLEDFEKSGLKLSGENGAQEVYQENVEEVIKEFDPESEKISEYEETLEED